MEMREKRKVVSRSDLRFPFRNLVLLEDLSMPGHGMTSLDNQRKTHNAQHITHYTKRTTYYIQRTSYNVQRKTIL